jgi:LysM repeat protein
LRFELLKMAKKSSSIFTHILHLWVLRLVTLFLVVLLFIIKILGKVLKLLFGRWMGALAKAFFRGVIVPFYKYFRWVGKYLGPAMSPNAETKIGWVVNRYTIHVMIAGIIVLTVVSNVFAQEVRADEFGRNTLLFDIVPTQADGSEKLIVEEAQKDEDQRIVAPTALPTERYSHYLASVTTSFENSSLRGKAVQSPISSVTVVEGGSALVKPTNILGIVGTEDFDQPLRRESTVHVVQSGDTLSTIALDYGVSVNTLLWENGLSSRSIIRPGDRLTILPVSGISYTIRSGDTLLAIARRYDSSVKDILEANALESDSTLRIGQKLLLPGARPYRTPSASTQSQPSRLAFITDIFRKSDSIPDGEQFVWPVPSRKINQYFKGWRHTGVDVHGTLKDDIYAVLPGTVVASGWNSGGYGYRVIIDHGGGMQTLSAHASKLFVKKGDKVVKGQAIGKLGSTGRSTGPHIHFEVIVNGVRQNPLNYY